MLALDLEGFSIMIIALRSQVFKYLQVLPLKKTLPSDETF